MMCVDHTHFSAFLGRMVACGDDVLWAMECWVDLPDDLESLHAPIGEAASSVDEEYYLLLVGDHG
jgi:hypothetical protein